MWSWFKYDSILGQYFVDFTGAESIEEELQKPVSISTLNMEERAVRLS